MFGITRNSELKALKEENAWFIKKIERTYGAFIKQYRLKTPKQFYKEACERQGVKHLALSMWGDEYKTYIDRLSRNTFY